MFLSQSTHYRCNQEIVNTSSAWELSLGLVDPEFGNCEEKGSVQDLTVDGLLELYSIRRRTITMCFGRLVDQNATYRSYISDTQ